MKLSELVGTWNGSSAMSFQPILSAAPVRVNMKLCLCLIVPYYRLTEFLDVVRTHLMYQDLLGFIVCKGSGFHVDGHHDFISPSKKTFGR